MLETIRDAVERRGYPPSMREIGEAAGLSSPSSVSHQPGRPGAQGVPAPRPAPAPRHRGGLPRRARGAGRCADGRPGAGRPHRVGRRPSGAVVRAGGRAHRGGRPDPRRAGRRGGLPAPPSARGRGPACSCSRWSATRWWTPRSATATGWSCASSRSRRTATSWRPCSTARRP
nr:hypothetical protein [Angustibacter aerolatus]